MSLNVMVSFSAAVCAVLLGFAALWRKRDSLASWSFFAGMLVLAVESIFGGLTIRAIESGGDGLRQGAPYLLGMLVAKSVLGGIWLTFSLVYCRGNYREFLLRWRMALIAALVIPVAVAAGFYVHLVDYTSAGSPDGQSFIRWGMASKVLNVVLLVATVLVLVNVEKTFRSTVGTVRWRVKFMVLGLGVLFGSRIYTQSQALLFSHYNPAMTTVEAGALILACFLMAIAYLRSGFTELEIYPSRAVLQGSFTIVVAGGYLFVVGVLAQIVAFLGGPRSFSAQAFVVLIGIAGLSVLLLSDRFRLALQRFVSRHFERPQHDFRKVWAKFSQGLSKIMRPDELCAESSRLISETFSVLSTTILLVDKHREQLMVAASTSPSQPGDDRVSDVALPLVAKALQGRDGPFDLDEIAEDWAELLRQITPVQFGQRGGHRICVPLVNAQRFLGIAILADRVKGVLYTQEELDLLRCIGDEIAAGLHKLSLTEELMQARELEAFQAMSAFFVHDMKNAASSLNLTLQNLPVHFDDPEFREDALRGIAKTADRINQLTARLSALRKRLQLEPEEMDLNDVVTKALENLNGAPGIELEKELQPLPKASIDREQIQSVVTNLVLNARDAVGAGGHVRVKTRPQNGRVVLSVEDDGCGMDPEFLKNSLFRPFQSTKKQGLGIGMFQSRMIIEAHHGSIHVESEPEKGTTISVSLPVTRL